jgi:sec-independent protein translocase protein TatC
MSQELNEQPFMAHLLELRDRLLRMVLAVVILLAVLFPFGNDIFTFLSQPVADALPEGSTMLATKVLSPFLTPLKLAFVGALFLAMPYLLYQIWGFVAPGLYQHERRLAFPILSSSILLFYLGAAFAYYAVLPILFPFLVGIVPDNVQVAPDIADFLDVAIKLFFAFGLAFEVPIATILLVVTGMTTPDKLAEKRPYVIVGAFVVGMLMTPPDVISQTMLAIPVWFLFECGLIFSRLFLRRRRERQAAEEAAGEESSGAAAASSGGAAAAAADPSEIYEGEYDDDPDWTPVKVEVPEDYRPLSEEEMERQLDQLDEEDEEEEDYEAEYDYDTPASSDEAAAAPGSEVAEDQDTASADVGADELASDDAPAQAEPFVPDAVDAKLEQIMELRNAERYDEARTLLYEVLVEGSDTQVKVARNILAQLDT